MDNRMLDLLAIVECSHHLREASDRMIGTMTMQDGVMDDSELPIYARNFAVHAGHYGNALLDLIAILGKPTLQYRMLGSDNMTQEQRLHSWDIF